MLELVPDKRLWMPSKNRNTKELYGKFSSDDPNKLTNKLTLHNKKREIQQRLKFSSNKGLLAKAGPVCTLELWKGLTTVNAQDYEGCVQKWASTHLSLPKLEMTNFQPNSTPPPLKCCRASYSEASWAGVEVCSSLARSDPAWTTWISVCRVVQRVIEGDSRRMVLRQGGAFGGRERAEWGEDQTWEGGGYAVVAHIIS